MKLTEISKDKFKADGYEGTYLLKENKWYHQADQGLGNPVLIQVKKKIELLAEAHAKLLIEKTKKQPKPKKFRNRSITKAKLLFIYIIGAGALSFIYAISCVFTGFPLIYAALPYSLLIAYGIGVFLWKNWRMIWVFIQNIERGRLLMLLNNSTAFEYSHKMKVIEWIYPRKNSIRFERWQELGQKQDKTPEENKELRKKQVRWCPQQLLDGVQKMILVRALIYAHENIQVLDDELRGIMQLTDENIDAFDFYAEVAKCTPKK